MLLKTPIATTESIDNMGRSAVHIASSAGAVLFLDRIFDDDDPNTCKDLLLKEDYDGWTPFHWACRAEDDFGLRFLIDKAKVVFGSRWHNMKHKLITKDGRAWTALDVARFHHRREVELLISLGMTIGEAKYRMPDLPQDLQTGCDFCNCVSGISTLSVTYPVMHKPQESVKVESRCVIALML